MIPPSHKVQLRMLKSQNSSHLAGIECLCGNFLSRLDEIPATDARILSSEMEAEPYKHAIDLSNCPVLSTQDHINRPSVSFVFFY